MEELQRYYKESLLNNLCKDYKGYWQSAHGDKKKLVDLALMQQSLPHLITYSYNGKGLSKEYIMREFDGLINGNYTAIDVDGVQGNYKSELYVGFSDVLSASADISAIMWSNIPLLRIKSCKAQKLYIACKSEANIECDGYDSLTIMLFDESKVIISELDEESIVNVYRYSKYAKVELGRFCFGNVNIHDKELRL